MEPLLSCPARIGLECGSGGFGGRGHPRQVRAWRRSLFRYPHARICERVTENVVLSEE
jgi:hypothetical protein